MIMQRILLILPLVSSVVFYASAHANDNQLLRQQAINAANAFITAHPEAALTRIANNSERPTQPIDITYQLNNDQTASTLLNSYEATLVDLGRTILAENDVDNLWRVYTLLYNKVPAPGEWPKPTSVKNRPLAGMQKLVQHYVKSINTSTNYLDLIPPSAYPAGLMVNPIGDCLAEVGYEYAGLSGEAPDRCHILEYATDGLMANFEFPLKNDLTCIKDQGRRGTCVAHAIAAMVETLTMVNSGTAENLSEQDIYYEAETEVDGLVDKFYDGLPSSLTVTHLEQTNYQIQLEDAWNYNRSINRASPAITSLNPVSLAPEYANSSDALYWGEMSNNYAYQGTTQFSNIFPLSYGSPSRPALPATGAREITSVVELPVDFSNPTLVDAWLYTVIALVTADTPVMMSFASTSGFQNPDPSGYVRYSALDSNIGGHVLALIGFVANADLPANVLPAIEEGFFIAKNSWGTDSGDCGFVYLDYTYVKVYANYFLTMTAQ